METSIFTIAEEEISGYEKIISVLKVRIASKTKENIVEDEKTLAELEQKEKALKKKLETYEDAGIELWYFFKFKFNHDMDKLRKALKYFMVTRT
jgi:hypothetical protein